MNLSFYPRLAFDGLKKNRQLVLPYGFTCVLMVMMYYILRSLTGSPALEEVAGSSGLRVILSLGTWVISLFSVLFLFYTHSFLTRRRKKEFGLYSVLGMGRRQLGAILCWETLLLGVGSVAVGLGLGITFSKLAELLLINISMGNVRYDLWISPQDICWTVLIYGGIFLLILLHDLLQVGTTSTTDLLKSEAVGEKAPKANWFLGLVGVLLLAGAYWMALTIQSPLEVLTVFFGAVLLVIVGTYLLLISSSVAFCRLLQKNKRYYYKKDHFVSVSSMAYRMKRNGAGLASICILATMVLVMLSSTSCLYFGTEHSLNTLYPRDINITLSLAESSSLGPQTGVTQTVKETFTACAEQLGSRMDHVLESTYADISGVFRDSTVILDPQEVDFGIGDNLSDLHVFYFIPLEEYNRSVSEPVTLAEDECLVWSNRDAFTGDSITFQHGKTFRVREILPDFAPGETRSALVNITSSIYLVVPDLECALGGIDRLADYNGDRMINYHWGLCFDTGLSDAEQLQLPEKISTLLEDSPIDRLMQTGTFSLVLEGRAVARRELYGLYGGLLFLGVALSIVFLIATVLIMYYKQITEGFEDQRRFQIMQNVGMTRQDIRKSIHSQLLTLFFLPLILAGCHMAFAYPMVKKLLMLFISQDAWLFAWVTAGSLVAFALLYMLVYRITAGAYYRIVAGRLPQD